MRTNIDIDDELMTKTIHCSGAATKKAAVEEAMRFYVQMRSQRDILNLAGKISFYEGYDYKKMRETRMDGLRTGVKTGAKLRKSRVAA